MDAKKLLVPITSHLRYHTSESYREKTKAASRERYRNNREKLCKYYRDWRKKNPGKASLAVARWIDRNRDRYNEIQREAKAKRKRIVLDAYGSKCSCCGEHRYEFLTIEHLFKNGAKHRKKVQDTYRWLIANKFPREGFTILCYNCNMAEGINKVCPHKIEKGISNLDVLELHQTIEQ